MEMMASSFNFLDNQHLHQLLSKLESVVQNEKVMNKIFYKSLVWLMFQCVETQASWVVCHRCFKAIVKVIGEMETFADPCYVFSEQSITQNKSQSHAAVGVGTSSEETVSSGHAAHCPCHIDGGWKKKTPCHQSFQVTVGWQANRCDNHVILCS